MDLGAGEGVERWRRILGIAEVALELDRSTREAYLETLGRQDEDLRRRVLKVLQSMGAIPSDEEPTVSETSLPESVDEDRIGPWRLLRLLGRGGMGSVFLAERDDSEYERQVAVKVISGGFEAPIVYQRFLSERQILAGFDHPHIARLFDAGTARQGRPYLVMEYIDGVPIDQYCFEQNLSVKERLELFKKVCSAVAYAHRNLVVHRDLKPSNILVTPDGEPKLLDFGIAKLLDPSSFPVDLEQTRTVHRPMTPNWASPEQLRGDPITTGTDIYALGLLLYKLLTGSMPHGPHRNVVEALASLKTPPIKPSQILLADPSDPPSSPQAWDASQRGKAGREVSGDLDNILLKTLRPEAAENYGSVEALEEDLRRYETSQPISATKGSVSYLLRTTLRRNRVSLFLASTVILFLSIFALTTQRQARLLEIERDKALISQERVEENIDFLIQLFGDLDRHKDRQASLSLEDVLRIGMEQLQEKETGDELIQSRIYGGFGVAFGRLGLYREALEATVLAIEKGEIAGRPNQEIEDLTQFQISFIRGLGRNESAEELIEKNFDSFSSINQLDLLVHLSDIQVQDRRFPEALVELMKRIGELEQDRRLFNQMAVRLINIWLYFAGQSGDYETVKRYSRKLLSHQMKTAGAVRQFNLRTLLAETMIARDFIAAEPICDYLIPNLNRVPGDIVDFNYEAMCGRAKYYLGDTSEGLRLINRSIYACREILTQNPENERTEYFYLNIRYYRLETLSFSRAFTPEEREELELIIDELSDLESRNSVIYVTDALARALLLAGRAEEARPIILKLIESGWRSIDTLDMAFRAGLIPDPSTLEKPKMIPLAPSLINLLNDAEDVPLPWEGLKVTDVPN